MATEVGKPVQIRLREDQIERLAKLGEQRGISVDELVQEGVDTILNGTSLSSEEGTSESNNEQDPLWELLGMADGGPANLSSNHHKYFIDALEEESRRWHQKSS